MIIKNSEYYGSDCKFHYGDIAVAGGVFTESDDSREVLDGSGCYAIPGLIDIHLHGAAGADVCDAEIGAFERIAEYEIRNGVTSFCPATLTLAVPTLEKVLKTGAEFAALHRDNMSELVGFNMEGPFISRNRKGSQNGNYIIPCDAEFVDKFMEWSDGLVKIVGLAPEENPGFEEYVKTVSGKVKVSLAHTDADYDTAVRAFRAGASHVTHLYNAMTGLHHRDPGVVGAAADCENVTAELICDGVHVHPAAVRAAFRLFGAERIVFVSDSLRCTGMADGVYDLGGQNVNKTGNKCTLVSGGNIAGSASDLYTCLRTAVQTMGIPLETAVRCVTINPAKCVGVDDRKGTIRNGNDADLVLLDKQSLEIKTVIKNGKIV